MAIPVISAKDFANTTFDFLVVGGGTAGLVVASRLSEDENIKVGVLEAGSSPYDTPEITVPGRYGYGIGTEIDWQFETVPQPKLRDRKLPWARGKVLGGSSSLNFLVWCRPCAEDLDAWEELGNKGWGWKDVLPFYKKSETFSEPESSLQQQNKLFYDRDSLGDGGPLPVSYMKEFSASHQYWHETLNNVGVRTNNAHLAGSNVGAWTSVAAVDPKTVTRASSCTAYLLPNANRKNLFVLTGATVQEIIIEQKNDDLVATGVRFLHSDGEFAAKSSKEVILSAGSIVSPQLLELSGIGSPSLLEKAGIAVKVENPNVGENLQDHIMTASIYEIDPSTPSRDDLLTDEVLAKAADEVYETQQAGLRTILSCSLSYIPLEHFVPREELKSLAARVKKNGAQGQILTRRLTDPQNLGQIEYIFEVGNWNPNTPAEPNKKYGTLLQILQYPFSFGSIHIGADKGVAKPVIDPQYYDGDGELDLEVHRLCAQFGRKILDTPPLRDFVKKRVWPPENVDGEELKDWLIDNTVTDWHPVGTCAMGGKEGIQAGVVDDRLRVYGVKGLRVVDASIMPLQISAHLQATVYAIAEKGSHMILEDLKQGH